MIRTACYIVFGIIVSLLFGTLFVQAGSAAVLSRLVGKWPAYPKQLMDRQ